MIPRGRRIERFLSYLTFCSGYENPKALISAEKISEMYGYRLDTVRKDFRILRDGHDTKVHRRAGEMARQLADLFDFHAERRVIMVGNDSLARARLSALPPAIGKVDVSVIFEDGRCGEVEAGVKYYALSELEKYLQSYAVDILVFCAGKNALKQISTAITKYNIASILNLTDYQMPAAENTLVYNASLTPGLVFLQRHLKNIQTEIES